MTDSIQKNKMIRKLIKIISEKQSIIEKLKKNAKNQEKEYSAVNSNKMPIIDQRLKEDITSTSMEVKLILQKVHLMEEKIEGLTEALNQEVSINTSYEEKIRILEERQNQYLSQIDELSKKLREQQKEKAQYLQENGKLHIENQKLVSKIEEFKIQQQYQRLLEAKLSVLATSEQNNKNLLKKICQNIESLHERFCKDSQKRLSKSTKVNQEYFGIQSLCQKLEQLEDLLKDAYTHPYGDVLNQTLDGFSIIMRSFQEKLDGVACLTDRNNACEVVQQEKNSTLNSCTLPTKSDNSIQKSNSCDKNEKYENNSL